MKTVSLVTKSIKMKEILIRIPESKFDFFLELIKNLQFAKVETIDGLPLTVEQQAFVDGLKEALEQAELHRQGKIKLNDARSFLLELKKQKEQTFEIA